MREIIARAYAAAIGVADVVALSRRGRRLVTDGSKGLPGWLGVTRWLAALRAAVRVAVWPPIPIAILISVRVAVLRALLLALLLVLLFD